MEKAVKNGLGSVFFNKGENCIAAGRLFVEETIYDEFLERSVGWFLSLIFGTRKEEGMVWVLLKL